MKKFIPALFATTLLALSACVTTQGEDKMAHSNTDKALALLKSFETGDRSALAYINPDKYIQHNLGVEDGLAGLSAVLEILPKDTTKAHTVRAFEEGDYVFTHTEYNIFGPKVGFDIFRFENGKVVEHWDNLSEKTEPNPSGRTQTDGPTKPTNLDKTETNKKVVIGLLEAVFMNGEFDKMSNFIDPKEGDYIQHNSHIGDGLSGLGTAFAAMHEKGITVKFETIHKVLAQGNFVLSVAEGEFGGQPVSFYDLFRVENEKIVEHWDIIEPIPNKAEWKNDNGKFNFPK